MNLYPNVKLSKKENINLKKNVKFIIKPKLLQSLQNICDFILAGAIITKKEQDLGYHT